MTGGNVKDYSIATIGSHTALQILHGAKQEGFRTIAVCEKGKEVPYVSYRVADEILTVDSFADFFDVEDELIKKNAIVIPHGSFISYLDLKRFKKLRAMHYGNKNVLDWESDKGKQREWLKNAGLLLPKIFKDPETIDRPVIIKFHGAAGGHGYFLVQTPEDFWKRLKETGNENRKYIIQEYIIGVPLYIHYFYSLLTEELEIMGFDKRYESNVDSIGRIAAKDQMNLKIETSYDIIGNIPLVIRESLLPKAFELGQRVVDYSKEVTPPGLYGPFCLETIVTPEGEFFVFEISARIVAGTNVHISGSPYAKFRYREPMSTGRRIARELKNAIESGRIKEVLG